MCPEVLEHSKQTIEGFGHPELEESNNLHLSCTSPFQYFMII